MYPVIRIALIVPFALVAQQPTYDFQGQIRAMQDTKLPAPAPRTADLPLSAMAREAVLASQKWREESVSPITGADGRVMYSFGAGLPTVVCAPLRVCIIELQPGERIAGEPQVGDSVRWNISPAMYGAGESSTPVIVLKPHSAGLDTDLLITTDRRAYYIRLISKPEEYVARVAFVYPEDQNADKWRKQKTEQTKSHTAVSSAVLNADRLNFAYRVQGNDEHLRPLRVFDDGEKTYIQMPPDVAHRELPALVVVGPDGKGEMTNYRVQKQIYVVDRLFDQARLVLGTGKKAKKVEIFRETRG